MKHKLRAAGIAIAVISVLFVVFNIFMMQGISRLKDLVAKSNAVEIRVKDYKTGNTLDVKDSDDKLRLCEQISQIRYKAVFKGETQVEPEKQAYSITVSGGEAFAVLIISKSEKHSRLVGEPLSVSISDYDSLYETVAAVFK